MSMEQFTWSHLHGAEGETTFRNLTAEFGDGYKQVAGDGINTKRETWPLQFMGKPETIAAIKAFLDAHAGRLPFLWTPPMGVEDAFYAPDGYSHRRVAPNVRSLTVEFVQFNTVRSVQA